MKTLPPPPGSIRKPSGSSSQQAVAPSTFRYDDDQMAVIECRDKCVVAEAFAGAGKTSTAIGYAAARPEGKILYVCLNKANQVEASARFGSNVECRTSHSLAYAAIGHKFREQLVTGWKTRVFQSEMRVSDARLAAATQAALNQFFCSRDNTLDERHIGAVVDQFGLYPHESVSVLALARVAWQKMQIPGSGISVTHDAYLKMWAIKKPVLSQFTHIILDEAQDTNPVTASIVEAQHHATRLLIGDRHQSIYLFRGALNAMEQFANSGATVLKMPKTWRFGPQIAKNANDLLGFFKSENTQIIGAGPANRCDPPGKRAVLSRTNAGLYAAAAAVMGKSTHWVGGIETYRMDQLMSSYFLKRGRRNEITDPVIRSYPSWGAYVSDSEISHDSEAKMVVKMNEEYRDQIPMLIESFRRNALPTQDGAKLVLTTAHRAKGLDWDQVKIGDDFHCIGDALSERLTMPNEPLEAATAQEINLLYVAITRARREIELNKETKEFFKDFPLHLNALVEATASSNQSVEQVQTVSNCVPA